MPVVPINYVAVLVAAAASIVIGFLWYGPLFGTLWMSLSGISASALDAQKKKGMGPNYLIMIVSTLVMSYVLAHALVFASVYLKVVGVQAGLMAGFWNWLGFIAPVTLGSVLWEGKSWKLWGLNNAYQLLSLVVMGVVLAHWT